MSSITCTNHCSKCGQHFHSLAAYDAHRRGKHMPKKGQRGRRCISAEDAADTNGNDLFLALTTHGTCKLSGGVVERGITIWTLRDAYTKAQQHFTKLRPKSEPVRRRRHGRRN